MTRRLALLMLLFAVPAEAAETVRVENRAPDLAPVRVEAARAQVAREYEKLKVLFDADVGPVILVIRPKGVGRHVAPNRILIPAAQVGNAMLVSAHELTHLLTQGWANDLLKEGLAVYGQDHAGESPAWPDYGQDIHQAAWAEITVPNTRVRGTGDANAVLSQPHPGETRLRLAAYRVAGSWVRWLIEEKMAGDVMRFMASLYRSGNYKQALGEGFQQLRPEWRAYVRARVSARR
jgi:hypothetical protein